MDRTVWVDESTFNTGVRHLMRAWVPIRQRGRVPYYITRSGRSSVSVFGGLCAGELLPLYIVSGRFTGEQYRDILKLIYAPVLSERFAGQEFKYQQDNSPVHHARAVSEWLDSEDGLELRDAVLYQPPYSPDLNPIEHVWARMKMRLRGKTFRTRDQYVREIMKAWSDIGQDRAFLRALCNSMVSRMDAVEEAMGGPTRY